MPKYTFSASVTVSAITVVEADTPEEAREIAGDRSVVLDTSWKSNAADEAFAITEADGEPFDITLQETEEDEE